MNRALQLLWQNPGLAVLWLGLAVVSIALVVVMRTRDGKSKPLQKCVLLSLLAHAVLVLYAATVRIAFDPGPPQRSNGPVRISQLILEEETQPEAADEAPATQSPVEDPLTRDTVREDVNDVAPQAPSPAALRSDEPPQRMVQAPRAVPPAESPKLEQRPPIEQPHPPLRSVAAQRIDVAPPQPIASQGVPSASFEQAASPAGIEAPRADLDTSLSQTPTVLPGVQRPFPEAMLPGAGAPEVVPVDAPRRWAEPAPAPSDAGQAPQFARATPQQTATEQSALAAQEVPEMYQLRLARDRQAVVESGGGSDATEAAVRAALTWLAQVQEADGRWDARRHGAGRERRVLGHDREGAGARADTGVTGLALLAFLGGGHTHVAGSYKQTVRSGLEYLLRMQARNGSLAGNAETYSAMYCHGMATLALAEAYGLTHDPALEQPLRDAISYTLAAQHPTFGGWRYQPGDARGDTSQLGWQLMAIKSAEAAGLRIPERSLNGMRTFLKSVSFGRQGGLASYRTGERVSRPMTAEALFCRLHLGTPISDPAVQEAVNYVLEEIPGQGEVNFYYWYYATLAMYQVQGEAWEKWNQALQQELIWRQTEDGSWNADCVWAGYGGKVYATAVAALCLEVYYRYQAVDHHEKQSNEVTRGHGTDRRR